MNYLFVAIFGVLGCWSRYGLTILLQIVLGRHFPLATLTVNVLGSFAMGFLFVETLERLTLPGPLRTGMLTGLLGGFTTFSTFSVETLGLLQHGELFNAALYLLLSVGVGLTAAFSGAFIARNL